MSTIKQKAMFFLLKELKQAKLNLARAETKTGTDDDRRNLSNKVELLEWTIGLVNKEG